MSLDTPSYVISLQNNIRSRPIPWDGAVRAKTIADTDFKKIKAIDKVRKEERKQVLENEADSYVALFLGSEEGQSVLQSAAKRQDMVVYLLVLLDDSIEAGSTTFVNSLLDHQDPFAALLPFLKATNTPDEPLPLLAALVLTKLFSKVVVAGSKISESLQKALESLLDYLSTLSKSSDAGHQDIAVQSYSSLLRSQQSRELFWSKRHETVEPLMDILRAGAGSSKDSASTLWSDGANSSRTNFETGIAGGVGIQLLYRVLLVIWQLSFEADLVGEGLQSDYDILILYVQLLRISPKEKITRLLISTLSNLITANRTTLLPAAGIARLSPLLASVKARHLSDPDLIEDLDSLISLLDEYTKTQTNFSEYAAEVRGGHLRWSPPHRNPTFWAENARRILDDDKGELPRLLTEILSKPWDNDKQVLAIACNDVACLVKEVPEKRPALQKLGLKTRVMELMQDPNESVRWESLRAVGEWLRYSFD